MNKMKQPFISVAMAAYNGESYIGLQLDTIINQIREDDEIIVSYNESSDNTKAILDKYSRDYKNIRVIKCEKKGIICNFENAIRNCSGEYIFLADQDDIWLNNKISRVMECFHNNPKTLLVMHNCEFVDDNLTPLGVNLFNYRKCRKGFLKNLIINGYQGCCIAFRSEIKSYICPIPDNIAMHDQWIGLICEIMGEISLLDDILILYRRHGDNNSVVGVGLVKKVKYIIYMIIEIIKRKISINKEKNK